jgi:hypothetical protein
VTGVKWHGRTFDISVGQRTTTVSERTGPPLQVRDRAGRTHTVTPGKPLRLTTRHPAATAGPVVCSTPITAVSGDRCVDVTGGDSRDGTALQLYDCNRTASQIWSMPGDGTVRAMGKCMDVRGGTDADGTPVQLYTCNDTASQQWVYDTSARTLRSFGKCLTASGGGTGNGTKLELRGCDGGADQQWKIPS